MAGLLDIAWEFTPTGGSTTNITVSGNDHYDGGTTGNPDLTIKSATDADDGNYTCYASNTDGSGKSDSVAVDILSMLITLQTILH